ncbi:MAG TPA: FxSxx-COOH system tetratricopeptide repeat protein [Streptosporangiaceae bacterium]|nr:FxSxx-COOH system tetratricopeptide repeat protein [Streptosporangiaceae bacterium]
MLVGVWEELCRQDRQAQRSQGDRAVAAVPTGHAVVGEIPREPPGFVARETLGLLADAARRGQVAVLCAVTGLRGVGKTQLAAAYARQRVSEGWGLVGWVNAETPDSLLAGLARVAARLGVADPAGDSRESARRLREHLQTRAADALLVLDNAASPEELRPFLPATGRTQIVVTSTEQAFTEFGEAVDVAVFTRPESVRYLRARTGLADKIGAMAVADALGDLPLALAQAAATIRRQHLTYRAYLDRLLRVPVGELLGAIPGGDYPYPTAAALLLSVQATEADDPAGLASQLLRVVAALSPEGVRRDVLAGLAAPGASGDRMQAVDGAAERCVAGSLLTWSVAGDAVIMHRLLGRVLRERDQADGQWPGTVTAALDLLEPRLFPEEQAWARRVEGAHLITQADALWDATAGADTVSPDLRLRQLRARRWAARQLWAVADFSRAADASARVLADCERILGPDHPDTLVSRENLAGACADAGRLDQAILLHERNLAERERTLGVNHLATLESQNGLAYAYLAAGRLDQAIPLFKQALASREQILGADHPETLKSRGNLAAAYASAGRLDEAIALDEQNLADRQRTLGPDHPSTLLSRHNLAAACASAGQLDRAIALHEQNLADRQRTLGPDHPATLKSRDHLAAAYASASRLDEAIALHKQNLADRERTLGPDHPDTCESRDHLEALHLPLGGSDGEELSKGLTSNSPART